MQKTKFETRMMSEEPDAIAPDGSKVFVGVRLAGGSTAQFELAPGQVSVAVSHKTVDEIWQFISGTGKMWRKIEHEDGSVHKEIVDVQPGVWITIPLGTHFQFRADEGKPLVAVGLTMPPWPLESDDEAFEVEGIWEPTVKTDLS